MRAERLFGYLYNPVSINYKPSKQATGRNQPTKTRGLTRYRQPLYSTHSRRPIPPALPLSVTQRSLLALISHTSQISHLPPLATPARPACLPHETDDRLLFRPALIDGYVRQVCGAVTSRVVGERDPETVLAKRPV